MTDAIKLPTHYKLFEEFEVIEIIAGAMTKEQFKGFCLGNIIKYRLRAGNKDALEQDIGKADYYKELYETHNWRCQSAY